MAKVNKKKFYLPGTLGVPGTKITLKTQPYTNGVIFNVSDPISSFRQYIALTNRLIKDYEKIMDIPGMKESLTNFIPDPLSAEVIGRIKLLMNYLVESPTELILKEQKVDNTILTDLEANNG